MIMKSVFLKVLCIFSVMALTACGGGGGEDSAPKDLFSLWHEEGTDSPIDLTEGGFNQTMRFSFFFTDGAQCNCDFTVIGGQSSGSYVMNSCRYKFGSGSEDPNCNAINSTGQYENKANVLTIISPNGTTKYF